MKIVRRILGIFVMIAGILGLVLSLAGLVSLWVVRPTVVASVTSTIQTLETSIKSSQQVMEVTGEALGATVDSVDALSSMLSTTATSVEDTQPVLDQINVMMGETVPSTLEAAAASLETAQEAAVVLDSAIKSLESFQTVMSATPFLSSFVQQPKQAYNPKVPLADSLGDLAENLATLPATFTDMSTNLDKADDNMVSIQDNLVTMSGSVKLISGSLGEYQAMISQSQSSMDGVIAILTSMRSNLTNILNGVVTVFSLFFLWLLAAQVVILSQGWELYQGTADRMEGDIGEA
jgi:hypothetical protein